MDEQNCIASYKQSLIWLWSMIVIGFPIIYLLFSCLFIGSGFASHRYKRKGKLFPYLMSPVCKTLQNETWKTHISGVRREKKLYFFIVQIRKILTYFTRQAYFQFFTLFNFEHEICAFLHVFTNLKEKRPYRSFGKCNAFWSIGLLLGF